MSEHPKWKYHASLPATVVEDSKSEDALGKGWFDTPAEAYESAPKKQDDDDKVSEEERAKLFEIAKDLGLKPHHKTGADKLLDMIQEERARLAAE